MWPIGPAIPQTQPPGAKNPTPRSRSQTMAPAQSASRRRVAERPAVVGAPLAIEATAPADSAELRSSIARYLALDVAPVFGPECSRQETNGPARAYHSARRHNPVTEPSRIARPR